MYATSTLRLSSRMIGIFLATVALLSLRLAFAQQLRAKPPILPAYNLQSEMAVKGTVDDINLMGTNEKTKVVRLVVKAGAEALDVVLCPKAFLDDLGVSFSKGDQLEIRGSKVRQDDLDEVLAREIVKGNDTIVLRDKEGNPVWN